MTALQKSDGQTGRAEAGPWVAFPIQLRGHGGRKPIFDNGIWWILPEADQERCPIAIVDCGDDYDQPTRERAEFNARLVAAAPELLAALQEIVTILRHNPDASEPPRYRNARCSKIAAAAIAKATGASS